MPHKVWQVGEEVLAADFNTYIQNQAVIQFPNVAARDTWTTAPNGAMCVTTDTGLPWVRRAGVWAPIQPPAISEFAHSGGFATTAGQYDMGTTNLGPYTYRVIVAVSMVCTFGVNATTSVGASPWIATLEGSASILPPGSALANQSYYAFVPWFRSWTVAAGANAGFKTSINITAHASGTTTYQSRGFYTVTPY